MKNTGYYLKYAGITLLVVLILGGVRYMSAEHRRNPASKVTAQSQDPEYSIGRGLQWLQQTSDQIDPYQWLLLDYLQRQYQLDEKFDAANRVFKLDAGQLGLEFEAYRRIIEPNKLVSSLPLAGATVMNQMMMEAANCDHIPLPATYRQLVQKNIELGNYNLTHASFSLERIKDNGCTIGSQQDEALRQTIANGMVSLVNNPETSKDLRYEAVAFLLAMGRPDLVQKTWIERITAEQKPDGSWGATATANDHSTVLALWALLLYSRPEVPRAPMIQRPTAAL